MLYQLNIYCIITGYENFYKIKIIKYFKFMYKTLYKNMNSKDLLSTPGLTV